RGRWPTEDRKRDDIARPISARARQGQTINSFSKKLTNTVSSSLISTEHGLALGDAPGPEGEAVDGPASFHRHCDVTAAHRASSTLVESSAGASTRLHSASRGWNRLTS